MPLTVHQFPCLQDNYGFLIQDQDSGITACIDTPDANAILQEAQKLGWHIDYILNTHWHPDHAGGNEAIKAAMGAIIIAPKEVEKLSPVDRLVADGDVVMLGKSELSVMDTGGHTLGHISYHCAADQLAFVGDTLFPMGCGRLFEGSPEQMWTSLGRLAALAEETVVYSAHEYTQANCRFALSVDGAAEVVARAAEVDRLRAQHRPTVPTTIGAEKRTNPFLRAPLLASDAPSPAQAFAQLRAAKDNFTG